MKPDPTIRLWMPDDLEVVTSIEQNASPWPWTLSIFSDCLKVGYPGWVIEDAHQTVVAFVIVQWGVAECHILNLAVDKLHQRQGFARALLNYVIQEAEDRKMSRLLLEVRASNLGAINLYQQMGFQQDGVRKHYYRTKTGHEDALLYSKNI